MIEISPIIFAHQIVKLVKFIDQVDAWEKGEAGPVPRENIETARGIVCDFIAELSKQEPAR